MDGWVEDTEVRFRSGQVRSIRRSPEGETTDISIKLSHLQGGHRLHGRTGGLGLGLMPRRGHWRGASTFPGPREGGSPWHRLGPLRDWSSFGSICMRWAAAEGTVHTACHQAQGKSPHSAATLQVRQALSVRLRPLQKTTRGRGRGRGTGSQDSRSLGLDSKGERGLTPSTPVSPNSQDGRFVRMLPRSSHWTNAHSTRTPCRRLPALQTEPRGETPAPDSFACSCESDPWPVNQFKVAGATCHPMSAMNITRSSRTIDRSSKQTPDVNYLLAAPSRPAWPVGLE